MADLAEAAPEAKEVQVVGVATWVAAVVLAASPVDLGGSQGTALGIHSRCNLIQSHNRRTQNPVRHRRKIRPQDRCTCQHREEEVTMEVVAAGVA